MSSDMLVERTVEALVLVILLVLTMEKEMLLLELTSLISGEHQMDKDTPKFHPLITMNHGIRTIASTQMMSSSRR